MLQEAGRRAYENGTHTSSNGKAQHNWNTSVYSMIASLILRRSNVEEMVLRSLLGVLRVCSREEICFTQERDGQQAGLWPFSEAALFVIVALIRGGGRVDGE